MGFLDKIKKFAGGKSTASVEVTEVEGLAPAAGSIPVSATTVTGSMRVTAEQDCVMIATKYEVILRTLDDDEWGDVIVASAKDKEERKMKAGDVFDHAWQIDDVEIARYLRNQEWDPNAAVGHDSVKLIVNCIADVKGSPFDPSAEVEVALAEQAPLGIETTVIEGMPADGCHFPVTDSVLKGTVVVTANEPLVLTATKYRIIVRIDGDDIVVARDQDPELEPNPLSVSFGGTYIKFPLDMGPGKRATHTWMVDDIDLAAALAERGFEDPNAAVHNDRVQLVVQCVADVEGATDAAATETVVSLQPG